MSRKKKTIVTNTAEKKPEVSVENNEATYSYDRTLPLLTIVIPVYKTKKFLNRCIDSVLNQTYKNIEVICVDDASPDDESSIIREYMTADARVRLVSHGRNRGLFQARISGMKYAKGDYYAFLDSDDHVSMDYYRLLMNRITAENADMVISDFADEYEDGRLEYYNFDNIRFSDINLKGDEVYKTFMRQRGLWFGWHTVWNKIYKKSVWDASVSFLAEFSEENGHLIMTEDIAFSCVFWRFARRVVNEHGCMYYYYHHSGQSVANSSLAKFEKNVRDVAAVMSFFKRFLIQQGIFDIYSAEFDDFYELYIEFWTLNADPLAYEEKKKALALVKELFGKVRKFNYKNHFHYSKKTALSSFCWYEEIKRSICSQDIETVSFDIFDTLIVRPFFKPSDLFFLLNDEFNKLVHSIAYVDFHKFRVQAEEQLRLQKQQSLAEEVALEEIYAYIAEIFKLDDDQTAALMQKEKELELKYAQPRKSGMDLYSLAKFMGKRVICTSDIYLDKETIAAMLKKCGYEPDEIYLSRDYLLSKATGHLFNVVLKKESIAPTALLHIGDNWDSDLAQPQKLKIVTYFLPAAGMQFRGENNGIYTGYSFGRIFGRNGKQYMGTAAAEYLGTRCMLAVTANKIFDNPYLAPFNPDTDFNANPYYIGYYCLGMHLLAVTRWLTKIAVSEKRGTIHFVSRDGYLPKKAFELIKKYRQIPVEADYLYISRKASAQLQNASLPEVQAYIGSFSSFKSVSPETAFATYKQLSPNATVAHRAENKQLEYLSECRSFDESIKLGRLIFDEFIDEKKAKKFTQAARRFFDEKIKPGDILFDLGYRANKEYILSSLIKRPVDCLYVYSNESNALARAELNGFSLRTFYDYTPTLLASVRELFFSEPAPSCVGYDPDDGMKPLFEDNYNEHYFNLFVTETAQNAALDFVDDFMKTFADTSVPELFRGFDASLPFEYFLHYSQRADRDILSCVTFEDDTFAGGAAKIVDEWDNAINWHGLNAEASHPTFTGPSAPIYAGQQLPPELSDLCTDGMFVKLYSYLNRKYPKGSKKRERMKRFASKFLH